MFEKRKVVAVWVLLALSAGLAAGMNVLGAVWDDFVDPKVSYPYLPGLGAVVLGLLVHVYLIRSILPIRHTLAQVLGILVSGFLAIAIYAGLIRAIAGPGMFISEISTLFWFSVFTGWLWFPLLTLLEHWAYRVTGREQVTGSVTKTAEELP